MICALWIHFFAFVFSSDLDPTPVSTANCIDCENQRFSPLTEVTPNKNLLNAWKLSEFKNLTSPHFFYPELSIILCCLICSNTSVIMNNIFFYQKSSPCAILRDNDCSLIIENSDIFSELLITQPLVISSSSLILKNITLKGTEQWSQRQSSISQFTSLSASVKLISSIFSSISFFQFSRSSSLLSTGLDGEEACETCLFSNVTFKPSKIQYSFTQEDFSHLSSLSCCEFTQIDQVLCGGITRSFNFCNQIISENCTYSHCKQPFSANSVITKQQFPTKSASFTVDTFEGCVADSSTASDCGGGVCFVNIQNANLIINSCLFRKCSSTNMGGSVFVKNAYRVEISSCKFVNSTCNKNGGGVFCGNELSIFLCRNNFFHSNRASVGGGFCIDSISCDVLANDYEIAEDDRKDVSISSMKFEDCSANEGGGILFTGDSYVNLHLTNSTIIRCLSVHQGSCHFAINKKNQYSSIECFFIENWFDTGICSDLVIVTDSPTSISFNTKKCLSFSKEARAAVCSRPTSSGTTNKESEEFVADPEELCAVRDLLVTKATSVRHFDLLRGTDDDAFCGFETHEPCLSISKALSTLQMFNWPLKFSLENGVYLENYDDIAIYQKDVKIVGESKKQSFVWQQEFKNQKVKTYIHGDGTKMCFSQVSVVPDKNCVCPFLEFEGASDLQFVDSAIAAKSIHDDCYSCALIKLVNSFLSFENSTVNGFSFDSGYFLQLILSEKVSMTVTFMRSNFTNLSTDSFYPVFMNFACSFPDPNEYSESMCFVNFKECSFLDCESNNSMFGGVLMMPLASRIQMVLNTTNFVSCGTRAKQGKGGAIYLDGHWGNSIDSFFVFNLFFEQNEAAVAKNMFISTRNLQGFDLSHFLFTYSPSMNEWKGSVMVYDPTAYLAPIDLISFLDMKHRSPYFVSGRQDNAIDWVTCGDEDTPCKSAGFVAQRNEKMDEHREIIVLDASYEFEPLKRMEVTIRSKDAGASHLSKMYLVPSKSYSFEESNRNDATSNSDANAKWHVQTDPPLSRGMVEGHSVLTISSISFVIGEQLQSKVESVFAFIECRCNIVYSIITTESLFALHIPVFAAENSNIELSDINLFDSTITNTQMSVFRNCCVDIDTLYVHNNNFQSSSFFSVEDLPSPSSSSSPSSFPSPLRSNTQMNGDISLSKCHFDSSQTNSPVFVIDCSLSFKLLISNVVFQTIGPIPEGPSIIYLKPKEKMHFLSEEQPVGNICIRINNCNFTECKSVCSYQGGIMHHRLSALSNSQLMVNSTSFNGGGIEKDGYGGAIFLDCRGGGCAFSITDNQFSLVRLSEGRCVFIVADDLKEVAHPMRIRVRRLTAVLSTDFRGAKTEDFDKMMEFVLYGKANSTNVCSNMKLNEAKDFEMETQDLHANYLNVSRYRTVYVDGADPNAEDSKACGTVGQPCKTFLAGAGRLSEDFCALCLSNSIEIRREMVLSSVEVQSCKSFERAQILIGEFDTNSTGALLNIFGEVHFSTCDFRFKNCETEHCSIFLAERNDLTVNNCSFSSFSEDYLSFAYVPSKKSPSHNSSIHPVSINASSKVTAALSCKLFLIVTGTLNMLYVTCSNLKFYVPAFTFEYNSQCSIIHSDFDSISLINSSLITKSSGKLQQKFSGKFELVNSTFTNIVCSQGGSAVLLSIDPFMPVKIQNCYFDGCGSNCSSVCGSVISVLFSGALISDTIFKGYKKPIPNERSLNEMNESIVNDVAMDIENKEEEEEDDDDVCGWRGAMMHLSTLPARLSNTSFINAPDGAVSMVSSSLAIASSSFIDNGVTAGKWKEIHHNIHCKGNGSVEVMSLAPDNSASNNRSPLWFQMEECSLILSPSLTPLTSSLFVPELTRVTYTANEQLLHMTFKGTNLFPCGLSFMLATSDPNDNPLSFEFSSFESSNIAYASVPISQLVFSSSSFSSSSSSPSPSNISVCNSLPSSHSLTSTQLSCEPKSSLYVSSSLQSSLSLSPHFPCISFIRHFTSFFSFFSSLFSSFFSSFHTHASLSSVPIQSLLACLVYPTSDYSVNDTAHTQYVVLAAEKTKSKNDISKEQVVLFISLSIGLSVVLLGVLGVIVFVVVKRKRKRKKERKNKRGMDLFDSQMSTPINSGDYILYSSSSSSSSSASPSPFSFSFSSPELKVNHSSSSGILESRPFKLPLDEQPPNFED